MLNQRLSLAIFLLFFVSTFGFEEAKHGRVKRQYYDEGYNIGSYYGCGGDNSRQFGRILGWGLGCLLVLLCLCLPCVCCIGIWFAGWFGLRRTMQNRNANQQQPTQPLSIISSTRRRSTQPSASQISPNPSGPLPAGTIIEQRSPGVDEVGVDGSRIQRVIYTQASDRFFERRRDQPPSPGYYGRERRY